MSYSKSNYHSSLFYDFELCAIKLNQCRLDRLRKDIMMKTLDEITSILREHKQELRQKYGVKETGLFGSYVRGDQKVTSDIDIVADFEKPISLLELVGVEIYLSEILKAKVDLIPREDIREELKESILKEIVKV